MGKADFQIGPCYTVPEFRGKGLYTNTLLYIISQNEYKKSSFWMIVDENNGASIRGIEKAGFLKIGKVKKTKLFKRYVELRD